ncbi:MAG: hypothetical protein PHO83_17615, partial [Geobacteraceae bacterium]|nr:hypothetical protein [Geobacteraceae bacterium]
RDYVNALLGHDRNDIASIASGYASTDFGRVGKETPLAVAVKRVLHEKDCAAAILGCDTIPSVCQFNPAGFYLEAVDGELVITKHQAVPLIRYRSGDRGELIGYEEFLARFNAAGIDLLAELQARGGDPSAVKPLPFVLVHGRADGGITFYGANIPVAQIRDILEGSSPFREHFTGNFQIRKSSDEKLDPVLELQLEEKSPGYEKDSLAALMARELAGRSSEYAKLLEVRGDTAMPMITVVGKDFFLNSAKIRYVDRTDGQTGTSDQK